MHEHSLHIAIRFFGSQKALAKALNVPHKRINHWLNRNKTIPFEYAIAIEKLTNGLVTRYQLAPHVHSLMRKIEKNKKQEMK